MVRCVLHLPALTLAPWPSTSRLGLRSPDRERESKGQVSVGTDSTLIKGQLKGDRTGGDILQPGVGQTLRSGPASGAQGFHDHGARDEPRKDRSVSFCS